MKSYIKILIILSAATIGITARCAFATTWDITDTTTYNLVNHADFPIQYGVSAVHNGSGDAHDKHGNTDYNDWVSSIQITPGVGNPANSGMNGIILPADSSGPHSVAIAVSGDYHWYHYAKYHNNFHGPKYQINFSYQGGYGYVFYNGSVANNGFAQLQFQEEIDMGTPGTNSINAGNQAVACITNAPYLQYNNGSHTQNETTTINFYDHGHKC